MSVQFFYGDEDYNIELEISEMKSKLNQDFISMSYQTYDNPDYQTLISALRTPPMMFGDMLIIINCDKYLTSNKNFFEDKELEDIDDALKHNPDGLNIVFVCKISKDEPKKPDSRRKLYKVISKYNPKEFKAFKTYQVSEISNWITKRAKKLDITLKPDAMTSFIEQIGNDLRQFDGELQKLKLIAYPEKVVTKKMVEDIAISNQDLFNMTEFLIKNQKDKALMEFKRLTDKKHPLEILTAIQTMLRKWILIKTKANSASSSELSKITGLPEFIIKQTITKLKNTKASELVNLKQNLFNVEYKIKSAEALDINSEVEIALIR